MSNIEENSLRKYFSLSPLRDVKAPVYFEALKDKLTDDTVRNIAVTGTYGSGKSSLLETYIEKDSENKDKYLRVSLANFCEANGDLSAEDEKKIEEHILQQLFYQLSSNHIPFSGFKRISHLNSKSQRNLVVSVIVWLFSLVLMPKVFKLLNANLQTISSVGIKELWKQIMWSGTFLNILTLGVFCVGLFYILKEIIRIIQKGQLKKVAMKSAQIELSEDSALNKHVDELIYFFEATDKAIVIIEDLDRFNSIVLFSKLREVNFLINNSPKVNQVVKFVYAIRDEIFTNNLNRTKFFDFILPIVPVINTTNSGDKLREFLKEDKTIPNPFINDISLYIHDLRLLKNIVNEYWIYNGVINENQKKKGVFLFSIILYKNLFPNDFGLEHSENGLLYKVFKGRKNKIIEHLISSSKIRIEELEEQKRLMLSATTMNETKLREEYVLEILKSTPNVVSFADYTVNDIITDINKFNQLVSSQQIQVYNYNYSRPRNQNISFEDIQNRVNQEFSYEERLELLGEEKYKKSKEINATISKLKGDVSVQTRKKLSGLIKQYKDNSWKKVLFNKDEEKLSAEEELIALLIRKGYLDENYQLYMSYFYEGALSFVDFEYLLNIKNNEGDNFNTKLTNINDLTSRISEDEYEYETTLNIELIASFLRKPGFKEDKRLELLLEQFKYVENAFEKYISPLINALKNKKRELQRLIELLVDKYYPTLWAAIESQNYDDLEKDEYLKDMLFLSKNQLQSLNYSSENQSLKKYLTEKENFVEGFSMPEEFSNVKKLIEALNIKFNQLEQKQYVDNQLFDFIYENCHYSLSKEMVYLMLYNKSKYNHDDLSEIFESKNLTCIRESESENLENYLYDNIPNYLEDVYLNLAEIQNEDESIIELFVEYCKDDKSDDELTQLLDKVSTKIEDIESFKHIEYWSILFTTNCVEPNWKNLFCYFKHKDNTLDDIAINWLKQDEVSEVLTSKNRAKIHFASEDDKVVSSMMKQIIENDSLEISIYENYLNSFHYTFFKINLEELSRNKISKLIELRKIGFNTHYYNLLISLDLQDELVDFIAKNIDEFIEKYEDYEFDLQLHKGLFQSGRINSNDQKLLLNLISTDNIDDSEIAELIGAVLTSAKENISDNAKVIKIIRKCSLFNLKLELFDKFLEGFDFEEIDIILDNLGGVYKQSSELRKRPTWVKSKLNLSIASKLKSTEYFHSVDSEDKDEIKIVVRYS